MDIPIPSATANEVQATDVDGDQDLDLLTYDPNGSANYVLVKLNDGQGNFSGSTTIPTGPYPNSLAVGDLDGDGDIDFLTGNDGPLGSPSRATISIRLNDGVGHFLPPAVGAEVGVASGPRELALADFDGDGDLDLLTTSVTNAPSNPSRNSVCFLENDGQGHFTRRADQPIGGRGGDLAVADIDGDGDLDFLVSESLALDVYQVAVLVNNGMASFSPHPTHPIVSAATNSPAIAFSAPNLADIDGDGDVDLIIPIEYNAAVAICLNDGTGFFGNATTIAGTVDQSVFDVADMNGDGMLDLLMGNYPGSTVTVCLNTGGGVFRMTAPAFTTQLPRVLRAADLDQDGDLDMVAVSTRQVIAVRLNQGQALPVRPARGFATANPLTLSPNPARTTTLTGALAGATVHIFDALGRQVHTSITDTQGHVKLVLPVELPAGIYVVRCGIHAIRLVAE
ncbi:T9SS type A sorting domain-containing protein [Hymenobacter persicinus]|nr:T9SS type A sorting domain-containing protein [Hymenobacter persicinus]